MVESKDLAKKEESKTLDSQKGQKPDKGRKRVCCCGGGLFGFVVIAFIIFNLPLISSLFVSGDQPNNIPSSVTQTNRTTTPPEAITATPRKTTTQASSPVPNSCQQVQHPAASAISISTSNPGFHQDVDNYYYQIYGLTTSDLGAQMRECGPKWEGGSYGAITNWNTNWQYNYLPLANGCNIQNVTVGVKVDIYYPKWEPSDSFQSGLATIWQNYIDALVVHENGHRDFALEGGQEILNTLSNLPSQTTCDEAGMVANETGSSITDDYSARSRAYDDATNHGETQGAHF